MMLAILFLGSIIGLSVADTPANCLYGDVRGTWIFYETERLENNTISCDSLGSIVHIKNFTLTFPNTATDELGNTGTWTMIYNQGFEVNINQRSYFAFSYYESDQGSVTSYCGQTFNGWSRDTTVRNWSCFYANKTTEVPPRMIHQSASKDMSQPYKNDPTLVEKINAMQRSWHATIYPELEEYTIEEVHRRGGNVRPDVHSYPVPAPTTAEQKARVSVLPDSFDWRDVDGVNYVSPVRDQGGCGSCFAFASMANLESQVRIVTQNQRQDIFSPQDAVSCSVLAQGCAGGFDYLIAGRYAQDQGVVAEECNTYTALDDPCSTNKSCSRTYVSEYHHVGGYYGACNEALMLEAIVERGPISVSFMVYDDFHNYEGGIYHHTGLRNEFNPFEVTNHVVLVVGYGSDAKTGEKYWIVKNSWGESWGENGFFRIRRGTDEVSFESMAVQVTIIP